MHGIRALPRNHSIKCGWVGCRRKRLMNRETIVRHIREVHLGLNRSLNNVKYVLLVPRII